MTRETRTGLVVAVAVGVAALASFGVYRAITNMPVRQVEVGTAKMVLAREPMPMGTRLTANNIKLVSWPSTTPIEGSFDAIEAVLDRGLLQSVLANDPITEGKLAPKEAGAGLSPSITPGLRALTIKANDVITVAGFVVPGTKVDVLATFTADDKQPVTRVIVSDVQVLTSGTRTEQERERQDGKPVPSTAVTLLLSPADAEKVALRNPMDVIPTETTGAKMTGLMGNAAPPSAPEPKPVVRRAPRPAPPAPVAEIVPPPAPKKPYTVEAYKAAKRSEEVIKTEEGER
jgi:pilus assembly protein CpaB